MVPLNAQSFISYAQNLIATNSVSHVRKEMNRFLKLGDCLWNEGCNYEVYAFVHQGYVIKVILDDMPTECHHHCPSRDSLVAPFFLWPVFTTKGEEIIIQPLAETSARQQEYALRTITYKLHLKLKRMKEKGEILTLDDVWPDPYECNVGVYKGKPFIIDFSHKYIE